MTLKKTVTLSAVLWLAAITGLHAWLNLDLLRKVDPANRTFRVSFIPVT